MRYRTGADMISRNMVVAANGGDAKWVIDELSTQERQYIPMKVFTEIWLTLQHSTNVSILMTYNVVTGDQGLDVVVPTHSLYAAALVGPRLLLGVILTGNNITRSHDAY